jgi:hypothetical protein
VPRLPVESGVAVATLSLEGLSGNASCLVSVVGVIHRA